MRRSAQREAMARQIARCAQLMADEHGLDGFTMEELAEAVGVSRRTLFNYVPGKIDAVLGGDLPEMPEPFTEFRAGGPTGDLVADMRHVGAATLSLDEAEPGEVSRIRRLLRSDPRLVKAVHERLEKVTELLAEAIVEREGGTIEPLRARVLARITLCIFDLAIDEFLADSARPVHEHYLRIFDTTTDLFG